MNLLVFDIETIPDHTAGRRMLTLGDDLTEAEVMQAMMSLRRAEVGHSFLRHHLQQIVAISVVLVHQNQIKVWSLGETDSDEATLIQRFFAGLDKYQPTLVSWNGCGFDLPVLHYRSLHHGIAAPTYWETGEHDQGFKWNNYLNRYHTRHTDIMDVLAGFQARANAPLDDIATLLGFPGKMGLSGQQVWQQYLAGEIQQIRDYCETDVLNTYLVYLRLCLIRGDLLSADYDTACQRLHDYLVEAEKPYSSTFIEHWHSLHHG